ncbi:hypothetical protein PRIPAC_81082, partial [Pristionchus pacificus]|uniref:Uncharacterized protein n=1 Tax=Pristionchus pacificus TaxID=54126 RepID=A0A2A6C4C0_PRIPA
KLQAPLAPSTRGRPCGPFAGHCESPAGFTLPSSAAPSSFSHGVVHPWPVMIVCRIVWATLLPSYHFPQFHRHAAHSGLRHAAHSGLHKEGLLPAPYWKTSGINAH